MERYWFVFVTIGLLFLLGVIADRLGRFARLPRVTVLILFGVLIGPAGLNIIKSEISEWYPMLADITLVMVGFLLGGKFTVSRIREFGRTVVFLSVAAVLFTAAVVMMGLLLLGIDYRLAIILAAVATATAPAATMDVISEFKRETPFTKLLEGIVALDDAWGLILFSILITLMKFFGSAQIDISLIMSGAWEIVGAVVIGFLLGLPMSYLSNWVAPGKLTFIESLGYIFLVTGIAIEFHVSHLLTAMVMGSVVTNFARRKEEPFKWIEEIEWPFIVIFFIIAGASIEVEYLREIGFVGIIYIVLRILGKIAGGYVGGILGKLPAKEKNWVGVALLPQAGVAIGMALVASNHVPELKNEIMNIVISTTIFFEVFGSLATHMAIQRVQTE